MKNKVFSRNTLDCLLWLLISHSFISTFFWGMFLLHTVHMHAFYLSPILVHKMKHIILVWLESTKDLQFRKLNLKLQTPNLHLGSSLPKTCKFRKLNLKLQTPNLHLGSSLPKTCNLVTWTWNYKLQTFILARVYQRLAI